MARRRSTRQSDSKLDGVVKVSAFMIDVIQKPVHIPVPTGLVGAKISTRNTPPLVRQMTSDDDLSANEELMANSKFWDTFIGGPNTMPLKIAGLTVDLAGDVTVGVASSADLTEVVTDGVASSADFTEVITFGVTSSADLHGVVDAGVASTADLAEVVTAGVASLADLVGDVTAGEASLADIAEVAPSADCDGDVTASVTPCRNVENVM